MFAALQNVVSSREMMTLSESLEAWKLDYINQMYWLTSEWKNAVNDENSKTFSPW